MYEVIFFILLALAGALTCVSGASESHQVEQVIFTRDEEKELEKELEKEIEEEDKKARENQLAKIRKRLKPKQHS